VLLHAFPNIRTWYQGLYCHPLLLLLHACLHVPMWFQALICHPLLLLLLLFHLFYDVQTCPHHCLSLMLLL
jgi:hypothetical protein